MNDYPNMPDNNAFFRGVYNAVPLSIVLWAALVLGVMLATGR